jgi:hypothetical protein
MSIAFGLLLDLRAAGLYLKPAGKRIRVAPANRVTPEVRLRILKHKQELLAALDLECRIRAMAQRWQCTDNTLGVVLERARRNPAGWARAVALDECREAAFRKHGFLPRDS